ncbi:MAG: AAA family ATPase [Lachnospiraceae bacterium]|nr:AAA family ATPase [Lachnospiraceae bacterium]
MVKCFIFENFKSFEKAELNIETLTTLIGTNASGKSNAIEGITVLAMLAAGLELSTILDGTKNIGTSIRGGSHGCTRFRTSTFKLGCLIDWDDNQDLLYEIRIRVNGNVMVDEEGLYLVEVDSLGPKKNPVFKTKKADYDRIEIKVQYKNGKKGMNPDTICVRSSAILPQIAGKVLRESNEEREIASMLEKMISQLKNIMILNPVPSEIRNYVRVTDVELRTNCDNLSAVLNKMCKKKKEKEHLLEIVKDLPENDILGIEFIETKIGDVIFALREKYLKNSELVDARQLSDGTLRCIAILTAILMSEPNSIIVIEEIDNGIHPARVSKLISRLVQIGNERQVDVVITTHNAALMNSYRKGELVGVSVVYREKEKGTSKITSFVDIEDFPNMLVSGGLGNAMIDESLLKTLKDEKKTKDYSWLGV